MVRSKSGNTLNHLSGELGCHADSSRQAHDRGEEEQGRQHENEKALRNNAVEDQPRLNTLEEIIHPFGSHDSHLDASVPCGITLVIAVFELVVEAQACQCTLNDPEEDVGLFNHSFESLHGRHDLGCDDQIG